MRSVWKKGVLPESDIPRGIIANKTSTNTAPHWSQFSSFFIAITLLLLNENSKEKGSPLWRFFSWWIHGIYPTQRHIVKVGIYNLVLWISKYEVTHSFLDILLLILGGIWFYTNAHWEKSGRRAKTKMCSWKGTKISLNTIE